MRVVWLGAFLAGALGLAPDANADIYLYRDPHGALHITNAPAVAGADKVIKDQPRPRGAAAAVPAPSVASLVLKLGQGKPAGTTYDRLIREVAERYEVEYALVKAIIKAESGFDRLAVSRKGAQGLMQLMPATAADHGVRNAFVPRENIEGGVRHLRMLLDRYGGNIPLAVAAYNAGQTRVENAGGIPSIPETREYLVRVLRYRLGYMREGTRVASRR